MTVDPTGAVLEGLALQRATGAPALACLVGCRAVEGGRTGTALGAGADAAGSAGPTDLAMLMDLAAGAAVRARIGGGRRLATTSLAVHLLNALPRTAELVVCADGAVVGGRLAVAGTIVLAAGEVLGHGSVAFAVLGEGLPPIPWEHDAPVPTVVLAEDELTMDERVGLQQIRCADARSWSEAVLRGSTRRGPAGLELQPSTLMANRAGGVQGGVLVGLAALAAERPDEGTTLSSMQVDFAAAATLEAPVRARVEVLRRGRRSRLVRVDLLQEDYLVVAATVVLRNE